MYGQNEASSGNSRVGTALSSPIGLSPYPTSAPIDRSPIDSGLNALQDRIESLHKAASALEQRFSPVLRSVPPSVNAGTRPTDIMTSSPVGGLLSDRIAQLRDLEARIAEILDRCEL